MRTFLDKIFFRSNNLNYLSNKIKNLTNNTPVRKIFEAINEYSEESEIRYVGGCVRKIINNEKVDDIDLATNLLPEQVCEVLKKKEINYYESGIDHGTITALIDNYKFEITTLRKDVSTDGRHAKVEFTNNWKDDASRRDFTINAIYSDAEGNLFDPYNGKKDLEEGCINFIGDVNKRIQEDYLRILRYIRFFLNYSKQPHNSEILRKLKINIGGVSKLSKERLLDELKKIFKLGTLEKLINEKLSLELILIIFPELKNYNLFNKLNSEKKNVLREVDFIFLLSLMIIDNSDNVDLTKFSSDFATIGGGVDKYAIITPLEDRTSAFGNGEISLPPADYSFQQITHNIPAITTRATARGGSVGLQNADYQSVRNTGPFTINTSAYDISWGDYETNGTYSGVNALVNKDLFLVIH